MFRVHMLLLTSFHLATYGLPSSVCPAPFVNTKQHTFLLLYLYLHAMTSTPLHVASRTRCNPGGQSFIVVSSHFFGNLEWLVFTTPMNCAFNVCVIQQQHPHLQTTNHQGKCLVFHVSRRWLYCFMLLLPFSLNMPLSSSCHLYTYGSAFLLFLFESPGINRSQSLLSSSL